MRLRMPIADTPRRDTRSARVSRRGRIVVALLAIAAFGGWCAGIVSAHAELVRSTPANGDVLDATPPEILLEFSESVDPIDPAIRLVDAQGAAVAIDAADQDLGTTSLRARIPDALDDGTYVVAWQAVSADSHRIRGAFTFSIGAATSTAPGLVDGLFDAEADGAGDAFGLGVGRFLSYGGIAVFVGLLGVGSIIAPSIVERRGRWVLLGALVAATVGTVVMIGAQAHLISGSVTAFADVIDTTSGRWWFLRLVAIAVLSIVMLLWSRARSRARSAARVVVPLIGVATLAIVAAGGHGISGDAVAVGFPATLVHLVAMAVWIGGLTLIALAPRGVRLATAGRVSPWALAAVVALAVSGTANAWRQLDGLASLTDSAYGRWLVVKVALVIAVIAVAAISRLAVRGRFDRRPTADESRGDSPGDTTPSAHAGDTGVTIVGRSVVVELVGMALILVATAGLVNTPPPLAAADLASASAVVGDRIAQIELDPAVTGGTEMHVYVTSPSGGLDRADEITVTAELTEAGIGPLELATLPAGPNHVIGADVDLPIAGDWTFVVRARYGDFEQVTFTMVLPVSD